MKNEPIVITGLGLFSPIGENYNIFIDNLLNGRTNIKELNLSAWKIDHPKFYVNEIDEEVLLQYIQKHFLNKIDPSIAYALIASDQAISNAGLTESVKNLAERTGISMGSTFAGMEFAEIEYINYVDSLISNTALKVSAYLSISMFQCGAAGQISIKNNIQGKLYCLPNGNTSCIDNIFNAYMILKNKRVDIMLAGTTEAPFTPYCISALYSSGILKQYRNNECCCTPFNLDNKGFILSEGSTVFCMERLQYAEDRGANIIGEVLGCYNTINENTELAGKNCLAKLFKHSNIKPQDVDFIISYGEGGEYDESEINVLLDTFGASLKEIPLTTIKPITGHALSASSGYEIATALWCLNNNKVVPFPSHGKPLIHNDKVYFTTSAVERELNIALLYSIDYSGKFSAILLKKFENA